MTDMRSVLWFGVYFVIILSLLHFSFECRKTYIVEAVYCDGRKSDTISVSDWSEPNSHYIDNYKKAVPEFRGHINVCDLKTIGTND